jgi:hypothetical protein
MGEAPNLTARLESAAEPGTVLISEEAHQFIAPLFETQPLEPIQVKGWEQPLPVFRVLAAKELPGKVRGIAGLESPLVGREAEFAALREALERLRAGVGGIVTLVGDAGIGKSRLVAELRKENLAKVHANRQVRTPSQGLAVPMGGGTVPVVRHIDTLSAVAGRAAQRAGRELGGIAGGGGGGAGEVGGTCVSRRH